MSGRGNIRIESEITIGVPFEIEGAAIEGLMEWRPRLAEAFTIEGMDGRRLRARLTALVPGRATLLPFEEMGKAGTGPEILLLQALPEKERMETVIQKTTELGVSAIVPFKSEKSISLGELDSRQKRSHNWNEVARKAAKQSRRADIPEVLAYRQFDESLQAAEGFSLKALLWEGAGTSLRELLSNAAEPVSSAAVLAGPEGGLTDREMRAAEAAGFVTVNLGWRVLRTETAAIFSVGLLRYELGG